MSRIASIKRQEIPVNVTSIVEGNVYFDGWQNVMVIDPGDAPIAPNGSRDFVLVVTGTICNFTNPQSDQRITLEVGVGLGGSGGGPDIDVHRQTLGGLPIYRAPFNDGLTFCFVKRFQNWPTSDKVRVQARICRYGGTVGLTPSFWINELAATIWSEDNLGASRYIVDEFTSPLGETLNFLNTGATTAKRVGPPFPWTSGTDDWLVFGATRYRPQAELFRPLFWYVRALTGSTTYDPNEVQFGPHGVLSRGTKLPQAPFGNIYLNEYWQGLAYKVQVTNTTTRPIVFGINGYNSPEPNEPNAASARLLRNVFFAVKLTGLPFYDAFTLDGPTSFFDSESASGGPPVLVERELDLSDARKTIVVLSGLPVPPANENGKSMRLSTIFNDGTKYPERVAAERVYITQVIAANAVREGSCDIKQFGTSCLRGINRWQLIGKWNPLVPSLNPITEGLKLCQVVVPDDDATNLQTPEATLSSGPDLVVVPAREAPAIAGLGLLPVTPSWINPVDVQRETVVLETSAGYRLSWPKFITHRRVFDAGWRAITDSEKSSLDSFVAGLSVAYFRFTIPGEAAERAFALVAPTLRFERDEGQRCWHASAAVVELIFTGP